MKPSRKSLAITAASLEPPQVSDKMSYLTFQGIKPTLQPAKDEGYPGYLTPPLGMSTPAGPGFGAGSQSSAGSIPEPEPQLEEAPVKPPQPVKRTRVLLSCAPCRVSKLKCEHAPCVNTQSQLLTMAQVIANNHVVSA